MTGAYNNQRGWCREVFGVDGCSMQIRRRRRRAKQQQHTTINQAGVSVGECVEQEDARAGIDGCNAEDKDVLYGVVEWRNNKNNS